MIRSYWKRNLWLFGQRRSGHHKVFVGDVEVVKPDSKTLTLIPQQQFDGMPNELVQHLRWMAQKHSLQQDIFLCGHPGPLKRRLAMTFANICGMEVEYVSISRDTTESDIKQRKEIVGSSVTFHDQAPVRAAIHGRLLILDGIEYAERNVLPTLNNLLENREMALEDGRFLSPQIPELSESTNFVRVHPNFRVIALGQCVPPYSGRSMDPPFRSRFQSRFIDELTTESILEINGAAAFLTRSKVQQLIEFYESLRYIRGSMIREGGSGTMAGLPVFSIDAMTHCIELLTKFPDLEVANAVERSVPACSWMLSSVPARLRPSVATAYDKLQGASWADKSRASYILREIVPSPSIVTDGFAAAVFAPTNTATKGQVVVPVRVGQTTALHADKSSSSNISSNVIEHQPYAIISTHERVLAEMVMDHACGKHLCLLGPKVREYMCFCVHV